MRRGVKALAVAALLLTCGGAAAQGSSTLDPGGVRALAMAELSQGNGPAARALARALLARDPADPTALLVAAEAALLAQDWPDALRAAALAHRAVEGPARFRAARIAAFAHAHMGQFSRAQIWLRRAEPDAPDAATARQLVQDYRAIRARNPLSVQLGFGIAPSSNVNGGSRSDTLQLPGLPFEFELSGDARALSGIAYSGDVDLRYRLRADARSESWARLQLSGRSYLLSRAARHQAPGARGSDYALASLGVGLGHRAALDGWRAPVELSTLLSRTWYGGDAYVDALRLSLGSALLLRRDTRLEMTLRADRLERRDIDAGWWLPGLRTVLRHQRPDGGLVDLTLDLETARTDLADTGFRGASLGADYAFARPFGPVMLSIGAEAELRDYETSRYTRDGRDDRRGALHGRLGLPGLGRYGLTPELTLRAERVWSDVDLFDEERLTLGFGLRSSF